MVSSAATGVRTTGVGALVAAEISSVLGTRMTYLALPWFVLVTTGSPGKMSLVLAAEVAPMAILGIPSGALVQRLGARTTMLVADLARAPILASIPLLHSLGLLDFPLLLGIVALLGCFLPPYFASQRMILPELVGEDERTMSQANSLIEGGSSFAALLGPALAGLLIPFVGASNVLYVDAATYFVAFVLVLAFVPRREPVGVPPESGLLAGVRFLACDRFLGPVSALVVATGFLGAALSAGLPVYAFDAFDGSSRVAGLFYAALGAGALGGSIVAVGAVRRLAPLRLATIGIAGFALPLWALPLLPPWPVVLVTLFLAMLCAPLVNGPVFAVVTKRTPQDLRAQVLTAVVAINTVAAPLGYIAAGQILERWGVAPLFTGLAAGITTVAIVFAALVVRRGDVGESLPEPATP